MSKLRADAKCPLCGLPLHDIEDTAADAEKITRRYHHVTNAVNPPCELTVAANIAAVERKRLERL